MKLCDSQGVRFASLIHTHKNFISSQWYSFEDSFKAALKDCLDSAIETLRERYFTCECRRYTHQRENWGQQFDKPGKKQRLDTENRKKIYVTQRIQLLFSLCQSHSIQRCYEHVCEFKQNQAAHETHNMRGLASTDDQVLSAGTLGDSSDQMVPGITDVKAPSAGTQIGPGSNR